MNNRKKTFLGMFSLAFLANINIALASVGNGGNSPPAVYSSTLPTLSNGQQTQAQTDNRGRLYIAPSSFPSIQPVSPATTFPFTAATTIPVSLPTTQPVSIATTLPVAVNNTVTTTGSSSVTNFPSFWLIHPDPSASPFPVTPATAFPIYGSTSVLNWPSNQTVSFSSSQHVICDSGCTGSGGSSSSGQYNVTFPTYSSSATVIPQYDINGLEYLSPQNNIQAGDSIYHKSIVTLLDGQVVQHNVDQFGDTYIRERNPLRVVTAPDDSILTDRSINIANASTSQAIMGPNPKRHGAIICNDHATLGLWIDTLGNAATNDMPSFYVAPLTCFKPSDNYPLHGMVNAWASSTAVHITAQEW